MYNFKKLFFLHLFIQFTFGNEPTTFSKVIAVKNADNTYLTNMIKAIDGGYILCGYWEKYDVSALNLEKDYEKKIESLIEILNNEIKEEFTDCNSPQSICEGDDDWSDNMGNGVWDPGELFVDENNNGEYDGKSLTDDEYTILGNYLYGSGSRKVRNANAKHKRVAYLKKVDDEGNEIWNKEYDFLEGYPYVVGGFENYIISFKRKGGPNDRRIWFTTAKNYLLTDINGNVIKSNFDFVEKSKSEGYGSNPIFTFDGNLVYANWEWSSSDQTFNLVFTDFSGNYIKRTGYLDDNKVGGTVYDGNVSVDKIINSFEGGFLLTGNHNKGGFFNKESYNPWFIKTDENGTVENILNFTQFDSDEVNTMVFQTDDLGYLFGGWTSRGSWDSYLLKFNNDFSQDSQFKGQIYENTQIEDLCDAIDNGFVAIGSCKIGDDGNFDESGYSNSEKVLLMHIGIQGYIDWYKWFPSPSFIADKKYFNSEDRGKSILVTEDGGYIIAGETKWTKNLKYVEKTKSGKIENKEVEFVQTKVLIIKTDKKGSCEGYESYNF